MASIDIQILLAIEHRLTMLEQGEEAIRSRMKCLEAEQRRRKEGGFWMKLKMPPVSQIVIGGVASWVIGSLINAQIGKDGNPLEIVSNGLKLLELLLK